MSRRRPCPYHISQARDEAIMALSDAKRVIRKIVQGERTQEDFWRLIAQLAQAINDADQALNQIGPASPGDAGGEADKT